MSFSSSSTSPTVAGRHNTNTFLTDEPTSERAAQYSWLHSPTVARHIEPSGSATPGWESPNGGSSGAGYGRTPTAVARDNYPQPHERGIMDSQTSLQQADNGSTTSRRGSAPHSPPTDLPGFISRPPSSSFTAAPTNQPFLNRHQRSNSLQHESFDVRSRDYYTPFSALHVASTPPPGPITNVQSTPVSSNTTALSTLWFGNLEPWMDIEYFNQVCLLMRWENVVIKMPLDHSQTSVHRPGGTTPLRANNPGYCFLTFATPTNAAIVFKQLSPPNPPTPMPNSKRHFHVNWAAAPATSLRGNVDLASTSFVPLSGPGSLALLNTLPLIPQNMNPASTSTSSSRQQEYSIFVGDLAPETTNSDLIAVFRDPLLGLRSDREPRFIRPFTSCKSAKIMVDPVLGVSKGYGFVRFSEEADQQRALIEMQGLYCLSRPMRISQATAKAKASVGSTGGHALQQSASFTSSNSDAAMSMSHYQPSSSMSDPLDYALPSNAATSPPAGVVARPTNQLISSSHVLPNETGRQRQTSSSPSRRESVAAEIGGNANEMLKTLPPAAATALSSLNLPPDVLAQITKLAATGAQTSEREEESAWNGMGHHTQYQVSAGAGLEANGYHVEERRGQIPVTPVDDMTTRQQQQRTVQARALLADMIGSNSGVLNSTDPYNTTVFVGGLSGLISEDTLRSFFGPFGEIHYVKIPPGKGCGFVQFVRKADAERAIERMQGFPIGGGRVRLSWGRSQSDKAAQAAAQAAQLGLNLGQLGSLQGLNVTHTAQLLQSLGLANDSSTRSPVTVTPHSRDTFNHPQVVESDLFRNDPAFYDQDDKFYVPPSYGGNIQLPSAQYANVDGIRGFSSSFIGPMPSGYPTFSPFDAENVFSSAGLTKPKMTHSDGYSHGIYNLSEGGYTSPLSSQRNGLGGQGVMSQNYNIHSSSLNGVTPFHHYSETSEHPGYNGTRSFHPNDILRTERSGSDSTSSIPSGSTSQRTSSSAIYDLGANLASFSFGPSSQNLVGSDRPDPTR